MRSKSLTAYPKIDNLDCEFDLKFNSKNEDFKEIKLNHDGTINLNTEDQSWNPLCDELVVSIQIKAKSLIIKKELINSALISKSKFRILFKQSSKDSNSTTRVLSEEYSFSNLEDIQLHIHNKENTLSGLVYYSVDIILSAIAIEPPANERFKSNILGSIICTLSNEKILRCDGDGSDFPIYCEPLGSKPLVSLVYSSLDLDNTRLDSGDLKILINTDHKDCPDDYKTTDNNIASHSLNHYIWKLGLILLFSEVSTNKDFEDSWVKIQYSGSLELDNFSITYALKYIYDLYNLDGSSSRALIESILSIKL